MEPKELASDFTLTMQHVVQVVCVCVCAFPVLT